MQDVDISVSPPDDGDTTLNLEDKIAELKPRRFISKPYQFGSRLFFKYHKHEVEVILRVDHDHRFVPVDPQLATVCPPAGTSAPFHLPLVPIGVLLLGRLQTWAQEDTASDLYPALRGPREVSKQQEVQDIRALLKSERITALASAPPWVNMDIFTEEFREALKENVTRFASRFRDTRQSWALLGFNDLALTDS